MIPGHRTTIAMRDSGSQPEKELLHKISEGDEHAFNKMVDFYTPMIYGTALAYIKIAESAEDATQEVFYKVWKNRAKLSQIDSLKDYLFILTRNEVLSALRKKGPRYPVGEFLENTIEATDMLPAHALVFRQFQQAVQKAITLLPPQQKQAFLLSREEGLPHHLIAERMHLSRNTVKNHIVAALSFIRQYIQANADTVLLLLLLFPRLL